MKQRRQAGFSVIEALVAIAVIAVALVPLVGLQIQVSRDHVRQRGVRAEIAAQRNALALLRDANIMETPQGERDLGDGQRMRWSATPLSRLTRTTDHGAGDGGFDVMLYKVVITIDPTGAGVIGDGVPNGTPFAFEVEQLGWRPVASATADAARTPSAARAPGDGNSRPGTE